MSDITVWLIVLLAAVALAAIPIIFQSRFIYFPLRYSADHLRKAKAIGTQQIIFGTSQGNQTAFFWQTGSPTAAPKNLWLMFGGNGDLALSWLDLVCVFPVLPIGFLLIDYPGYGNCQGKPNARTILENTEGAFDALLEQRGWDAENMALSVFGQSLGGAAALQFAVNRPVSKIVLISAFTSMDDMVRNQIGFSLGPLLQHRFDNRALLQTILANNRAVEISIVHGQSDEIVPFRMGATLAQLDSSRIKFVAVAGAAHNDIIQKALPQIVEAMIPGSDKNSLTANRRE
jgi:uncharacterized protein